MARVTLYENLVGTLYKPFSENIENMTIQLPPSFLPEDGLEHNARCREIYVFKMTTITPDPVTNPKDIVIVVIFGEYCCLAYIRPC